jgi:hypothetical protein
VARDELPYLSRTTGEDAREPEDRRPHAKAD